MEIVEIIGDNYLGHFEHLRYASRAVIIKDKMILLSYETKKDLWMIPGGGMEDDEIASDTAIREVREETGYIIKPSDIVLEIDEYYGNSKYVSYYFLGEVIGMANRKLTEGEERDGLEPRWIPVEEAIAIFSNYMNYSQEEKQGMYYREYSALKRIC